MSYQIKVRIHDANGIAANYDVTAGSGLSGAPVRVPLRGKANVELLDVVTGRAPHVVGMKRVGKSLWVAFNDGDPNQPDLVIEDYYDEPDTRLAGLAESGQYYEYIPTSGAAQDYAALLGNGAVSEGALGGLGFAGPGMQGVAAAGAGWLPWVMGPALGAAAVAGRDHDKRQVDNTPPGPPVVTTNTGGELAGTAEPGSTITVTDPSDGSKVTTVTGPDGKWSIKPNPLEDGDVNGSVTATDPSGNVSGPTTVNGPDTTPPGKPVVTTNTGGELAGTAEPGSTVTVTDPSDGSKVTTVTGPDGKWSIKPNPLEDGDVNGTVTATDPSGNVSDPALVNGPDTTPPGKPVVTTNTGGELAGTAEPGSTITITDPSDGSKVTTVTGPDGKWSIKPNPLEDGDIDGTVTATDQAGNLSDPALVDGPDTTPPGKPVVTTNIDGELAGTAEPGSTITVTDPSDGSKVTTVTGPDGKWSIKPNPLEEGDMSGTVTATDGAGNVSQPTDVDRPMGAAPAAPAIENVVDNFTHGEDADVGALQKGQATNDATLTINGTGTAGLTIEVYATNTAGTESKVGTTTVGADGKWTLTTSALGTDGRYALTAAAINAAGIASLETGAFDVLLDTEAPMSVTGALQDDQGGNSTVAPGGTTDDKTPTVTGTGVPGDVVAIYLDNAITPAGTATVDATGHWSIALPPLGDGQHFYTTKVTDPAGNETSNSTVTTFTVDTSTVAISIDQVNDNIGNIQTPVLDGGVTDDTTPQLVGKALPNHVVTIKGAAGAMLGTATADGNGSWTFQLLTQSEGAHTYTASVTNAAGVTATADFALTVDTTAPSAASITGVTDDVGTIKGPVLDGRVSDDPTPTLSGTGPAGELITIYDNGKPIGSVRADANGNWSFTPTDNLAEGEHDFTATATDAAGNESAPSNVWDVTLDFTPPPLTVTGNTASTLSGTSEPGAVITVTDPSDGTVTTTVADANGNWSMPNPLEPGDTNATVTATDPAGNTSAPKLVDYVGTAPGPNDLSSLTLSDDINPVQGTIADGGATNDTLPTYSGKAVAGITSVAVYDNGVKVATVPVDANGNWSYTPSAPLAEGSTHNYTAAAINTYGEGPQVSGTADSAWTFTIDTTPPGPEVFAGGSIKLVDDMGSVTGTVADGSTIDDAVPTYSGRITPAGIAQGVKSVNIYDNGVLIGSAAVDQTTGEWSFEPSPALTAGNHAFTVAAVDAAGNVGTQVSGTADAAWNFTLDSAAPGVPAITSVHDDVSHGDDADTGFLQKGSYTNDRNLTINGTGTAGLTIEVYATNAAGTRTKVGATTVDANGNWMLSTSALGADGAYALTATAINAAGIASPETGAFDVVLDTVAPALVSGSLQDDEGSANGPVVPGGTTDDKTPTIIGTGQAGDVVTVYLDNAATPAGTATVDANGQWSIALASLSDGQHFYTTKVTDKAGNETRNNTVTTFTVDSSAVAISIDQANDNYGKVTGAVLNGGVIDDITPVLVGTAIPNAVVTIKDASGAVLGTTTSDGNGAWSFPVTLAAGDKAYAYTASVTNATGNTATASFTLSLDTTAPAAPTLDTLSDDVGIHQYTTPARGSVTDDQTPTFAGTGTTGETITLYDNGVKLGSVVVGANGQWSYTHTQPMTEGAHTVTATSLDAAGNESVASAPWAFVVDITPPNVGVSVNAADELAGQTEAGAVVTVTNAAGDSFTAVADANGHWSMGPNPLAAGEKGTIHATDPAGNQGPDVSIQGAALGSYNLIQHSEQINTKTFHDQANPSVTTLKNGTLVFVWQDGDTSGGYGDVNMQLYDATGVNRIGTEQQINQRNINNQDSPNVAALADGGFIVTWESVGAGPDNSGDGIMARRYNAAGVAVTDEFLANVTTNGNQRQPSVMATPDGGYVISWFSDEPNTNNVIRQRVYDDENKPVTGETLVSSGGHGHGFQGGPEMAIFTDAAHAGMYVTVWEGRNGPADTDDTGVIGQLHKADGSLLGAAFQVNTTTSNAENFPDVITLKDGSFLVVWDTDASGSVGSDVRAAHYTFNATTGAVRLTGPGDFLVNTYVEGKQYKPTAVALNDGGYLVVWGSDGGDGSGSAIYAQRYDAHDNKLGHEFLVNPTTQGNQGAGWDNIDLQEDLDATLMADGNVYVTWQTDALDNSGFAAEGTSIDIDAGYYAEFRVNTATSGDQERPATAALPDGGFITVWQSDDGDGSNMSVKAQLFDAMGMPRGSEFLVNTTTGNFQGKPDVVVLKDGSFQVVWTDYTSTGSKGDSIMSQHFTYTYDTDGNVIGAVKQGVEAQVNIYDNDAQRDPAITALPDGGYLVIWKSWVNGDYSIVARQYDNKGIPVTGDVVIADTNADWDMAEPTVTTLSDGHVAIAYEKNVSGAGVQSCVRLYDPVTKAPGVEFVANQTSANTQGTPGVASLSDGNLIVTWDSYDHSGPDQSGAGIWGRIFKPDGTPVTSEFLVNTMTINDQQEAVVVARPDGGFIALYHSQYDLAPGAGTYGIYAQYFDNAGNKVGQQLQINQLVAGDQLHLDATFLDSGKLYVTWTDYGVGDQSASAVKGRLVDLDETLGLTPLDPPGDGQTLVEYVPARVAEDEVTGSAGNDVLDGRGASTVDGGAGDDWLVVDGTGFEHVDGGAGKDVLVWDSYADLNLGSVSNKLSLIEGIHMGNNVGQTLSVDANDVLDMTGLDASGNHVLRVTGDAGDTATGAKDTVDIDLAVWTAGASTVENGVAYSVYTSNSDSTVKLWIQSGMGVI